jgi:DNA invertase Pin-like site-specific DNA recombinase
MKRLFGYTRVSTAKQGEHGVSLHEQKDAILRYAEKYGFSIVEWFEERQTAAKRGRPVFNAMMKALRNGKADGVVIHKIDRSARNLRDWADLGDLIDAGVDVHFANETMDLKSRGGRLSADILAVVAADFIRNNREETRKGFYGRLKQGIYPLNAPLGYLDQGGGKPKAIDPVRGPLVHHGFKRYATGEVSLHALLEELHGKGLRNRRGNALTLTGLVTILRNPFYTGVIQLRRTNESFDGIHEPLITTALFRRVQDVFDGKRPRRLQVHDYRYRRLFACANCGLSLIASRHKGHVYYRCQNAACPTTCVREEALDAAVTAMLRSITVPGDVVDRCEQEMALAFANSDALEEATRQQLEGVIGAVGTRLDRLTDVYLEGQIDKAAYEERRTTLVLERQEARERIAGVSGNPGRQRAVIEKCLELARSPELLYENGTDEEKRRILSIVTSNRRVSGKNVEIAVPEPFLFLASAQETACCAPSAPLPRTSEWLADTLMKWAEEHRSAAEELADKFCPPDREADALAA